MTFPDANGFAIAGEVVKDTHYSNGGKTPFAATRVRSEVDGRKTTLDVVAFGDVAEQLKAAAMGDRARVKGKIGNRKNKDDKWELQFVAESIAIEKKAAAPSTAGDWETDYA